MFLMKPAYLPLAGKCLELVYLVRVYGKMSLKSSHIQLNEHLAVWFGLSVTDTGTS